MYNVFDILNPQIRVAAICIKSKLIVTWTKGQLAMWLVESNGFDNIDNKKIDVSLKYKDSLDLAEDYLSEFKTIIPQTKIKFR